MPIGVPPGPVPVPLIDNVADPGAIASKSTAPSRPVPVAPVASDERVIVMSTRPGADCWVNDALAPPDRMKLPSLTARTRSSAGSKVRVIVTVDSRDTLVTEIGTVYGPAPTLKTLPGGDRITWAEPSPGETVGASAGDAGGAAAEAAVGGGVAGAAGSGGG